MEPKPIHNTIAEVFEKIKAQKISIHSKAFFRLKLFAFFVLLTAICFISILLCSFILFVIRVTGQSDFIGFGSQGVLLFFALFPWILFLLDILLIGLLGMLMRHTSFGYKIPGVYIVGMILVIIIVSGYIVDSKTRFHTHMLHRADKKQLPLLQSMYVNVRRAPPDGYGIYRGVIIEREGDTLYVDIDNVAGLGTSTSVMVNIANHPRAPYVELGDSVFISGKIEDGIVTNAKLKIAPRLPPPN